MYWFIGKTDDFILIILTTDYVLYFVSSVLNFEAAFIEPQESRRNYRTEFISFWADFVVVGVSSTKREIFYRFSSSWLLSRAYHGSLSSSHSKSLPIGFLSYVRLNINNNNNNNGNADDDSISNRNN